MSILNSVTQQVRQCAAAVALFLCLSVMGFAADDAQLQAGRRAVSQKDFATALTIFTQLANAGSDEGRFYLGRMYFLGQGVKKDYAEAAKLFMLIPKRLPGAGLSLGDIYFEGGHGVTQDYAESAKWYLDSISQKVNNEGYSALKCCAPAKFNLGVMAATGKGLPVDLIQASKWFQLTAAADHGEGQDAGIQQEIRDVQKNMSSTQIAEANRLATAFIRDIEARAVAQYTGTWYLVNYGGTLEIKDQKGVLAGKGPSNFHIVDLRVNEGALAVTTKDLGELWHLSGNIDDGILKLKFVLPQTGPDKWFVRDEKVAQTMRKENDRAMKAAETPEEKAERRAQNLAVIAGVVGQVAQTRADIARTNAETQQRIEQQKSEQAARQQQQDQQQQEALNQRLAAQRAQQQQQQVQQQAEIQRQQQEALNERLAAQRRTQDQQAQQQAAEQRAQQQAAQQLAQQAVVQRQQPVYRNACIQSEVKRGAFCGDKDSTSAVLTNSCSITLDTRWCYEGKDGAWSCFANTAPPLAAGANTGASWTCSGTGRMLIWAREPGSSEPWPKAPGRER